ncbi:MAG: hypothetical protein JRL30_20705 [Deltaproteobacteria bacterium]|nr:hypothetical protein [Deltaproteobacteria bacterium]
MKTEEYRGLKAEEWPCPEDDERLRLPGAVLLSNEIKYYAENYRMIEPFKEENLKPAGIYLRLGPVFSLGGKMHELEDKTGKDELVIPPFQVAIIRTLETINLPRFLIARWNLRVTYVYKGLLWTGALQVDPGWLGQLPCPIYNLSNKDVSLRLGQKIVLMDFVKTTQFLEDSEPYKRRPGIDRLDKSYKLMSALSSLAAERIDKIERKVDEQVEKRLNRAESLVALVITVIAVLFAALGILVTSGDVLTPKKAGISPFFIFWPSLSMALSIIALSITLLRPRFTKRWKNVLIFLFGLLFIFLILNHVGDFASSVVKSFFSGV